MNTMNKIFIVGSAPLPNEKEGVREAAGLRTEQFLSPLQTAGHKIILVAISNKAEPENSEGMPLRHEKKGNMEIFWISRHSKHLTKFLKQKTSGFQPDFAIGVNTFPAYILSTVIPKDTPFWADLNGWIIAEGQARGWSEDTNLHLANAFRQERQILLKADKISTVSSAQKFATIGELASMGLLRKENFLEEKVFALPNCTKFFDIDKSTNPQENKKTLFRGSEKFNIPMNAFVIAWIGGYNNWVDEETLFHSVESAMSQNDKIYFVSTGGAIKNIANTTFSRFLSRINASPYKERFIFLGWIETADMRKIYQESDIGINIDFLCIETETGARNRLNEMIKFGLPVVTTGGSEIAEAIGKHKAGICVSNVYSRKKIDRENIIKNISKAILTLSKSDKSDFLEYRQGGQKLSTEIFSEDLIQKPVVDFAQNPEKSILTPLPIQSPLFFLKNAFLYLKRNGIKIFWSKIKQRIL